jgi:hypothetical protein
VFIAAGALALLAAATPAAAAKKTPPRLAAPQIVSGTPQLVHAYAAPATSQYVSDFPQPLVVHLTRPAAKVRFWCPATHCKLRVVDEADDPGHRVDPSTYEAVIKQGTATLRVGLSTDLPGHFEVFAQTVDGDDNLTGPKTPPFELWSE